MPKRRRTLGQEIIEGLRGLRDALRDRVPLRRRFRVRDARKPGRPGRTPDREAWLNENEVAKGLVDEGLRQAKAGRFSDSPPDLDADAPLAEGLADDAPTDRDSRIGT